MVISSPAIHTVDLQALTAAPLMMTPFPFVLVPSFIRDESFSNICADFPKIDKGGSYPLSSLEYGPAFRALCEELVSTKVRNHFERKLQIDLTDRPATITVRGQTVKKNGSIHIDSRSKLVTVLIYLNDAWNADGGRLRLLRSANDLDDSIAEVAPTRGAMVAFVNTPLAWHGHKPFVGPRRSIQLNWVVDEAAANSADRRHVWSARVKGVLSLLGRPSSEMAK